MKGILVMKGEPTESYISLEVERHMSYLYCRRGWSPDSDRHHSHQGPRPG